MPEEIVEITREELYEKVWSTPIVQLAKHFHMSDVGLAKICKRLGVPRPGLGYWRKVQTGQKPRRVPLPIAKKGTPAVAVIRKLEKPESPIEAGSEAQALIEAEAAPDQLILVSESLRGCHSLVSRANAHFSVSRANDYGRILYNADACLDLSVSKATLHRALLIMDALIKGLETRGFEISVEKGTWALVLGEKVQFSMQEKITRSERQLTAKEEKEKQESHFFYILNRYVFTPTGELKLQIGNIPYSCSNIQKSWSDTKHQRLENRLNDFVAGLVTASTAIKKNRLAWEEQHRQRQEEERRRAEAEKRRRDEEVRRQRLHQQLDSWEKSRRIRAFVKAVSTQALAGLTTVVPPEQLRSWVDWATEYATLLDPLHAPAPEQVSEDEGARNGPDE